MKRGKAALEEVLGRHKKPRIRVAPEGERTAGGRRWPSKRHREYYEDLEARRRGGELLWYVIEPTFLLPGGVLARFDFLEVEKKTEPFGPYKGGFQPRWVRVVDVKGRREKSYVRNVKQVRAIYGVEVVEA